MTTNLSLYTKRFFSGTFLSRLSGMARDLSMAFFFGDHPSVAAFMVAFRFSNLFRRLFGEGPFQSAFIPYFEGIRVKDPEKSYRFFQKITLLLLMILVFIIVSLEGSFYLFRMYGHLSESTEEILILMQWMLPGLIFICLYGLNLSLLQCHDSFFIPSFAPFVCNAIWIFGVFFLKNKPLTQAMISLSQLIVVGFLGQWLLTLPLTIRYAPSKIKDWWDFSIPKEVKALFTSFSLGTIGVGAIQINAFVDAIFARCASLTGPIYLWYSIRLEQLAFAIFGIACVSTVVPRLSRAIKSQDRTGAEEYFRLSFSRILSVMIPCTLAIFLVGGVSVNLLYGRGQFSPEAVFQTTYCLWAYTLGLIPTTMVVLYSAVYYAEGDFKTPMIFSVMAVLINILCNVLFVFSFGLGAISIALATSVSSWANFIFLQNSSRKKNWHPQVSWIRSGKIFLGGILALAFSLLWFYAFCYPCSFSIIGSRFIWIFQDSASLLIQLLFLSAFFILGLGLYTKITKNEDYLDLFELLSPFKRRKRVSE